MMRLLRVSMLVAFMLPACGGGLTDPNSRPRQVCQNNPSTIAVQVRDLMGSPVGDAEVVAKNVSSGVQQTARSGGNGFAGGLNDTLGHGTVEITATAGALKTRRPFMVQVVCGECDCTVMPTSATLTVE